MELEIVAGIISFLATTAGFLGAPLDDLGHHDAEVPEHQRHHEKHQPPHHKDNSSKYQLGSAHEHALFFVNINGTERNFTDRKFQVQSRYVHFENFRPHIVHKHSENITWRFFAETIDLTISQKNSTDCITYPGMRSCGNISMILNGKEVQNLDTEIQQGDNLAIIMPPSQNLSGTYMDKKLPEDFRKHLGSNI